MRKTMLLSTLFSTLVTLQCLLSPPLLAAPLDDLLSAAEAGDLAKVQAALDASADINAYVYNLEQGYDFIPPAIVQAARSDHPEVVRLLLQRGADPNANIFGWTALHAAVNLGSLELVKLLLEHKADPNIGLEYDSMGKSFAGEHGVTPMMKAAANGELEIFLLLRAHGGQYLLRGETPTGEGDSLVHALLAEEQNLPMIQALLELDFPLAQRADYLNAAAIAGDQALCELLLKQGALIDQSDEAGETALMKAMLHAPASVIGYLLTQGANPLLISADGKVALDMLSINSSLSEAEAKQIQAQVQVVVKQRLDAIRQRIKSPKHLKPFLGMVDTAGWTPLHLAIAAKDSALVKQLLQLGAPPNLASHTGLTPLLIAAEAGQVQAVKSLLKAKADPNLGNHQGYTPLALAGYGSTPAAKEIVKLLQAAGAKE
ncbi:MAG: hypothetical protein CVV27_08635 [Candidatus Melainabacteria bacterium HGW-Melainabacteria-1]|nr:MAG: hypothetical protein CVV27_08635 [Candidatus Melainabacteria bacterium HGW-Melainabacteria-1]